ncbi:glycosyltransferase family 4 protein [Roseiarcaceae bacterium H3SJ34-1]|uniref:glycosyltransferase family 4 protein n=1 Tax=Terripilifer ovatus TaxID=3032367 RepID=UPI003AB91EA5|nr:glycosyltransferase family 4 protein [Roseiarcaceae bacterium H3SJ34-1]
MHIVIVADHAYINGGQSKVAIESGLGLIGRGHKVTYFAAVGPVDPRLPAAGIETVCLGQDDIDTATSKLAFLKQIMWNGTAEKRLGAVLAGLDPADTVVHVHAWPKALSPSIGAALQRAGIPCVYTMHEFFMVCPNGGFYDYQRAVTCHRDPMSLACVTTNCDSINYPRKLVRVARQLVLGRSGLREVFGHIIMISALQYEVSRKYMPIEPVYHRVDNPIAAPDLGPKLKPGDQFLYAGRLSREKGIEHFCEAATLAGIQPVIAGDGPLMEELKHKYPQALFLGWQNSDSLRQHMRAARALVFPSVWYEGQPLTVYEALAMGTPVIVSDVCAGREAVEDGVNGLWFKSGDAGSLAAALRRLSVDDQAAKMTKAAYEHYWARPLSLDRHLDAIEDVYRQAIADGAKQLVA